MAIPAKTSDPTRLFSRTRIFNEPPPIPVEWSKTAMAAYSQSHQVWWQDTMNTLNDMAGDIETLKARLNAMTPPSSP